MLTPHDLAKNMTYITFSKMCPVNHLNVHMVS